MSDNFPFGVTALCPRCGIDSVIGDAEYPSLTPELLERLNNRSFG